MRRYERSWWWVKEKKQMALVFIAIITMMLQLHMKGCVGCLETERMGLLQLKSYLNSVLLSGEPSIYFPEGILNLKSWTHGDCCNWEGVKCSDDTGGHIVHLSLDGGSWAIYEPRPLNLSLLHSFPQLQTFNFTGFSISHFFDPIYGYKSFQRLEKLRTLNFGGNNLNNSILPFISAARSLTTLVLGGNNLNGVFPPNELANMTELRVMNLDFNRFSSFSVQELANMTQLRVLNLEGNKLSSFPVQGLISFTNLEILDLSINDITDIEAGDGLNTTKLKTLDLSGNNLAATTRLDAFKYMSNLQELDLSVNGFIDLDNLDLVLPLSLQVLNLRGNRLSSTPKVLKYMSKLQELDLSDNGFNDLDSLGSMLPLSLKVLDLSYNQMSSTPKGYSTICRLTYLQELSLQGNSLTNMPYCPGNLSHLRTLDLSDNQLNGNLSFFVSSLPYALEYLSLSVNNGSFGLNSLANHTKLTVFELSSKGGTIQHLTESSWVPLFQLKKLRLQNFILDSTIYDFLIHQNDLCSVDLSHNKLTGTFPTWLVQNNTRLQSLILNNNLLTDFQLPRLVHGLIYLDISSNMIYDLLEHIV